MKIGILIDELAPGGLQKTAIKECLELQKLGHTVTLLVLTARNSNNFKDLTKNINVEFLDRRLSPKQRFSFKFPIFAYFSLFHITYSFLLPKKIKKDELDIIVAHGTFVCPTALSIKKHLNIPVVSFIWDPVSYILPKAYAQTPLKLFFPILLPLARFFDKKIIKGSDKVLASCPSNYAQEIVPAAFDGPETFPKDKDYTDGYFLSVTKWNRGKNPFFLLDVFSNIDAKLIIAGAWEDTALLEEFSKAIKNKGLEKKIELITKVTENQLRNLYRKAKAFVYPNFEAFGMGALEAASYANPVIMPEGSGVTHFLSKNSGFFPKEKDTAAFIEAVKNLNNDSNLCAKLGKEAFESAQKMRWKSHAEKIESILLSAAQKKVLAFNLGFISDKAISGGDVVLMDMVKRLPPDYFFEIIVPKKGAVHWQQRVGKLQNYKLIVLKPNFFDRFEGALAIFLTYKIRSIQSLMFLKNKYYAYYSCSDVFCDIVPPFIMRLFKKRTLWISRVFHIYLKAGERRGSFVVNFVSTALQRFSWVLMKAKSQKILALNRVLAKDLKIYGFKDLPVLETGIDIEDIKNTKKRSKKYDGIFLGRLSRTKGVYDLVEIWAKVVEKLPSARLAIIGGGPKNVQEDLKALAKKLGVSANIDFLGFLPEKQEVYSLMKSSQVFVFPSHEEGWGIVVAEAMACGLPVVAYDLDIFGAVYKKGFLKAKLFDTQALATQVVKVLTREDYRKNLSKEALEESRQFDNSQVAEKFANVL